MATSNDATVGGAPESRLAQSGDCSPVPGDRAYVALQAVWQIDACTHIGAKLLNAPDEWDEEGLLALLTRIRDMASVVMSALDEKEVSLEKLRQRVTGMA